MVEFSTQTAGEIIKSDKHNAMLDHAFEKAYDFVVRKNGSDYEAVKGSESSGAGMITYTDIDAAVVWQDVLDDLSNEGSALLKGVHDLGTTSLTLKNGITIDGQGPSGAKNRGSQFTYSGTGYALTAEDLDSIRLRNFRVYLDGSDPLGCLKVGNGSTFGVYENLEFRSDDKTNAGQIGYYFESGVAGSYWNTLISPLFHTINIGMKSDQTGSLACNQQMIFNPRMWGIGATGMDFTADESHEHCINLGFFAQSANAVCLKYDAGHLQWTDAVLEGGTGSQGWQLGSNSSRCYIRVRNDCPVAPTDAGAHNDARDIGDDYTPVNWTNHAATALSGTKKLIEIDIDGTPYYFEVYPTKA